MIETAIIIPTYNARNTVVKLIDKILSVAKNSIVIVVDDSSPDKTAQLIRDHFSKNKRVLLIVRKEKEGRGSAVIHGLKEALKRSDADYFIEMDADFVHNPVFIPVLIKATRQADVVIASRYLKDSKNIDWKLKRRLFSMCVSFILRIFLRVPIRDYTNGYRCYKREVIEALDFRQIKSKGFIVLSELALAIHKKGFRFAEIPFTFQLYQLNKSNLKPSELKEAISTIIRLSLLAHV